MSRSKSPEMIIDKKHKPRLKSVVTNQLNIAYSVSSGQSTNFPIQSNKNRLTSIPSLRSAKHLKPKRSLKSFKSPLSKSPSNSILHTTKEDPYEKLLIPPTVRTENLRKIEEILKKVHLIEQESQSHSENPLFTSITNEKFDLFNKMFDEIIEKDRQYTKYLSLIKKCFHSYYEEKVGALNIELEIIKKEKNLAFDTFSKEKHNLQRTVETLSRENVQLSKDLEKCEDHISMLQQQLEIIHKFNPEEMPSSLENWKCLILENKFYGDLCKSMKKEIEVYKQNQEIFLAKFDELKEQGIDISYEFSECFSSSMENSLDSRGDLIAVKKQGIPNLNFSKISNSNHLL